MKHSFSWFISITAICFIVITGCQDGRMTHSSASFLKVQGQDIVTSDGEKYFIRGTNLGNWLNPEGYMFGFSNTNSPEKINRMFCELVGPDFTAEFWKAFKDSYVTKEDIEFLANTGINTLRVPFHYKLFTDEDYMGLTSDQDGFKRIDQLVGWCRKSGIHIILDMHDAPGGQTGDNIDDSHGYPWLFESAASQKLFCDIWEKIADHYKDEPIILGYDLINEPIAPYFDNAESLNTKLEPVLKKAVAAIREVDKNHIVMLGGAQWNSNFKPFSNSRFDGNMMYTCHRYGGPATKEAIESFISFRDSVNLPMYMGEIGHNSYDWQKNFCKVMIENNIGYTFWPYKKLDNSCFMGIIPSKNWDVVVKFAESPRVSFDDIRKARPDQATARQAMMDFIENCKLQNCKIEEEYIYSVIFDIEK